MPAGQAAVADDKEIVDVRWLTPGGGLRRARARRDLPAHADQKNLTLFEGAPTVAAALARLDGRVVSTVIRPRLVAGPTAAAERPLLPGDPGYL